MWQGERAFFDLRRPGILSHVVDRFAGLVVVGNAVCLGDEVTRRGAAAAGVSCDIRAFGTVEDISSFC